MKKVILLGLIALAVSGKELFAQAGAGVKLGKKHQAYVDSIKASDYKWIFPAWGKKISKRGFDLQYPVGVMVNPFVASQKVTISDLEVGLNGKEPVPLDMIKFGEVKANIKSVTVRPDLWILPFMDVYGIFGATWTETKVQVTEPLQFSTEAKFSGSTFGIGTTLAGGYHSFITIIDINHTWSFLDKIEGSVQATTFTPRVGVHYLFENKPNSSASFWIGAPAIFINRNTQGSIDLGSLSTNASTTDLQGVVSESHPWVQNLSPDKKEVIKQMAQMILDGRNGIRDKDMTIDYSLKKRPQSNWSMCVGGQLQFSHRWQVRTEVGFLGGRSSLLISGNYRFRW